MLQKATSKAAHRPTARRLLKQRFLPIGILAGFALLFVLLYGDRLWPGKSVRIGRVLAIPPPHEERVSTTGQMSVPFGPGDATLMFQASGWIEPDPLPIRATALTDGVIDEVLVLEGEEVSAGQLIATLIDEDARLRQQRALEELLAEEHAKTAHCAGIPVVQHRIEAAEARAEADQAMLGRVGDRLERLEGVESGAISTAELIETRFAAHRLGALADESATRVSELKAELDRVNQEIPMFDARIGAARARLAEAELAFARTQITAPVSGRVLRLFVTPGTKRMLSMDELDSATVAILYPPDRLQVRVDVPLADAAGLSVGQPTRIRCEVLPNLIFRGEVTRIVGEADIQRNTLQAKVRLTDPSPKLRPEMLCRVEFLSGAGLPDVATPAKELSALLLFAPESALVEGDKAVWVCETETRRVNRRAVVTGPLRRGSHRQVIEGLRPGEWVVLDPAGLSVGSRVSPHLIESP